MIGTRPTYIEGDHLSVKEYFKLHLANVGILYSSVWNWWKKTTWCCGVPLFVGCAVLFIVLLYQELQVKRETDWALVVAVSLLPLLMLPFIWIRTYYSSFVVPKKYSQKIEQFIATCIPDATRLTRHTPMNYTVWRKGVELEVAYSLIPEPAPNGKVKCIHRDFFIGLYYACNDKPQGEEEGISVKEKFQEEWKAYCEGKESCSHLFLDDYFMCAVYEEKDNLSASKVMQAIDQMQYLLERFNLNPLHLRAV